ncbi:endonuclease domain-containing protein [Dactylosporangium sp. NPDC051541]|uniref:endonuclease domain-containing protein n=1 Tax=Dactylosporangium sp. NPDC051541 TaxID=3363977 RepID=UPI00378C9A49
MSPAAALAHWWDTPPRRQVSHLGGAPPELLIVALDPLPAAAPAVVSFHPAPPGRPRDPGDQVHVVLRELDRAAIALYPLWLPGAEALDGPSALGLAAARALAERAAAGSQNFGPFLADLATRALTRAAGLAGGEALGGRRSSRDAGLAGGDAAGGRRSSRDAGLVGGDEVGGRRPSRDAGQVGEEAAGRRRRQRAEGRAAGFPPEVRAAGLARVLATAYGRDHLVVIIELPHDASQAEERALVHAAEWLVHHAGVTVWLAGAPLRGVDRVRSVRITLPPPIAALPQAAAALNRPATPPPPGPRVTYPPRAGAPRIDSPAEQALERALAACEWAHGRRWNHDYEPDILGRRYRLDLYWPAERLVVEVDGDEHRGALKYADDRQRDVHLQLHGHHVLRFTNGQVLTDVLLVARNIRQLLERRRRGL